MNIFNRMMEIVWVLRVIKIIKNTLQLEPNKETSKDGLAFQECLVIMITQWLLTFLEISNPSSFIYALTEPFLIRNHRHPQ